MKQSDIQAGATYGDGKNGVRRVYRVQDDLVYYEMVSGSATRRLEAFGISSDGFMKFKSSLRSFAAWAKEELELVLITT